MPIIIKSVGVTVYGGFVLLTSIMGIAFGLSSFGAGFRAQRFMPSARNFIERAELFYPQFYFNMIIIVLLSLLFVLFANQLNTYLFQNKILYSIWIVPLYLIFYLLYSKGSDYFRYTSRVHYMTLATLCFPYLHIGIILLYLYYRASISINMLVISMALASLLIAIPCFWVIIREIGVKLIFYKSSLLISDIKLGFPLMLGFIVDFILAGSDRYFIAFYMSVTDVGYYVPGYVLGSLIVFIPKAMGTALPQLLSKAVDIGNEAEAQVMLNYAIKIYLLLAIPYIFGCLALSKPILILLSSPAIAERAFRVVPIVAFGTIFYGLNIILSIVMFVRLKTNAIIKINVIAAILSLLANFILIYLFRNIIVAAITTFLSYFIAFIYAYKIVIREWFIKFDRISILKAFIASLIMYIIIIFLQNSFQSQSESGMFALVLSMLGLLVYAGVLFILKTFTQKEILYLKGIYYGSK